MWQKSSSAIYLEMILDNLDLAIALTDAQGKILYWNNTYLQMLKCTPEEFEIKYKNTQDVLRRGDLSRSLSLEAVQTKKRAEGCQTLYDVYGEPQHLYSTHIPIFDADGEVMYSLGIIQYVDKIKREYFHAVDSIGENVNRVPLFASRRDETIVYRDPQMERLIRYMDNVAATDATVLIQGESGTGKELFASYIHEHSNRAKEKLVVVNCAAIPADLFESELFGYVGGAFTGAMKEGKRGLIEEADGGTLFLDEINSMPVILQSKLLRAIEQKTIQKVGSSVTKRVDFRLITATNVDLQNCIGNGTFRLDLYFRLNVVSLNIPPLRERPEDITVLAKHFIDHYGSKYHRKKRFSPQAMNQLKAQSWQGNVRELKNVLERIFVLSDPASETVNNIAEYFFENSFFPDKKEERTESYLIKDMTFDELMEYYEKRVLREALEKYKSPKAVEEHLNVSHTTLFRKLSKYNLKRSY